MNSVTESLESLGLTPQEARAYLALLKLRKGSILRVAEAAGINRSTTYHILSSLSEKGLVSPTKFRDVVDYRIRPLRSLKSYVKIQEQAANQSLPRLRELYASRTKKIRVRTYRGVTAVKTILEKVLRERSDLLVYGDLKVVGVILGAYWEFFTKRSAQIGIRIQTKHRSGTTALFLWGDKVAFVDLAEPIQSLALKNQGVHNLFEALWNRS